ncbi:NACHT domain-containing protein [Leptolyngbya sp. 7M]|uniref:NACHT domain-containing protein n=1 Tax=Leptolyngbya sp. 7M TaxID=2812896 RepID=UPI001B8B9AE3|nr:NACHT domain-containing protein [Leptolyngbya sp. 7M]QYO63209.1 NACHT domain-containing protein [Leptolyngbya sp. 7M]
MYTYAFLLNGDRPLELPEGIWGPLELVSLAEFVDALLAAHGGKPLSPLQIALLQSAWSTQRQDYRQIAKRFGYSENYLKFDAAPKLWRLLSELFQEKVRKANLQTVVERQYRQQAILPPVASKPCIQPEQPDFNGAAFPSSRFNQFDQFIDVPIDVSLFYGRVEELTQLQAWIEQHCRILVLVGMGGIGKTALAAKLTQRLTQQDRFEVILWRSLAHAPQLNDCLRDLINAIEPASVEVRDITTQLLVCLKQKRCLIVLDGVDHLFQDSAPDGARFDGAGHYRDGYHNYGQWLRHMSETLHQSCLLLTSRETPREIAQLEGTSVRILPLAGLGFADMQSSPAIKGTLVGSDQDWQELHRRCAGNPLVIKYAVSAIQRLFAGNLRLCLQGTLVFGAVRDLLDQQFNRLSPLETELIYWLAIHIEPVSLPELQTDLLSSVPQSALLEAIDSLLRRSLIELAFPALVAKQSPLFTLSALMMEYLGEQLVRQIYQEIINQSLQVFHSHSLIKAQTKDYIREMQTQRFLRPLVDLLHHHFQTKPRLEHHLRQLIPLLHQEAKPGYAAGNLLNILTYLQIDLTGSDFSNLTIWQADLQGVHLQEINFSRADLSRSTFTKPLGGALSVAFSPDGKQLATSDINGTIRLFGQFSGILNE